jgi:hypothetical protein
VRMRLRLVTAESIPPHMKVGVVATLESSTVRLRLRCPRAERSGPCHGRVKLVNGGRRVFASGAFRIPTGHARQVTLETRSRRHLRGEPSVIARVRGIDRLGNAAIVERVVRLRHARP